MLVVRRKDGLVACPSEILQEYAVQVKVLVTEFSTVEDIHAVVADTCDRDVRFLIYCFGMEYAYCDCPAGNVSALCLYR